MNTRIAVFEISIFITIFILLFLLILVIAKSIKKGFKKDIYKMVTFYSYLFPGILLSTSFSVATSFGFEYPKIVTGFWYFSFILYFNKVMTITLLKENKKYRDLGLLCLKFMNPLTCISFLYFSELTDAGKIEMLSGASWAYILGNTLFVLINRNIIKKKYNSDYRYDEFKSIEFLP